jgi:acyl-CoA synthetase (NDP forming)
VNLNHLVDTARREGRSALLESEGLDLLAAHGIAVPRRVRLPLGTPVTQALLDGLPGARIVLKVESPVILHKSDVGGVRLLEKTVGAVAPVMAELETRLADQALVGFGLYECVPFDKGFGGELLVGIRRTPEFGPVVVLGPGGIHSEALAGMLKGSAPAVFHPSTCNAGNLLQRLRETAFTRFLTPPARPGAPAG